MGAFPGLNDPMFSRRLACLGQIGALGAHVYGRFFDAGPFVVRSLAGPSEQAGP